MDWMHAARLAVSLMAVSLWLCSTGCGKAPTPAVDGGLPTEITVQDLGSRIKAGTAPVLLDVREAEERAVVSLPGSLHIPLGDLPDKMGTLDKGKEIVVFCRSGRRSGIAVEQLRAAGFTKARSMTGGMNAWEEAAAGR